MVRFEQNIRSYLMPVKLFHVSSFCKFCKVKESWEIERGNLHRVVHVSTGIELFTLIVPMGGTERMLPTLPEKHPGDEGKSVISQPSCTHKPLQPSCSPEVRRPR